MKSSFWLNKSRIYKKGRCNLCLLCPRRCFISLFLNKLLSNCLSQWRRKTSKIFKAMFKVKVIGRRSLTPASYRNLRLHWRKENQRLPRESLKWSQTMFLQDRENLSKNSITSSLLQFLSQQNHRFPNKTCIENQSNGALKSKLQTKWVKSCERDP